MNCIEPMTKFLKAAMILIMLGLKSCSKLKSTASLVNYLILTKEGSSLKYSEYKKTCAVNNIDKSLVNKVDLIWLRSNSNHAFIVVEDLNMETSGYFAKKMWISNFFSDCIHIVEERSKFFFHTRQDSLHKLHLKAGRKLFVVLAGKGVFC